MNLQARTIETGCTIHVVQDVDAFHAHVVLDEPIAIGPGDKVRVHGGPVIAPFGAKFTQRRPATVTRAHLLERLWARLTGRLEFDVLWDVSFSPGRIA
jgi:hypothetical protein